MPQAILVDAKKDLLTGFITPLKERSSVKVLTCTNKKGSSGSFWEKTMEIKIPSKPLICHPMQ